ncbi:MAG: hypothetical protein AAF603_07245 [Pseudomonadota bacterium]
MDAKEIKAHEREVDENFEYFQAIVKELEKTDAGRIALLKDKNVIDIFDDVTDALRVGREKFGEQPYSVQEIASEPAYFGVASYLGLN